MSVEAPTRPARSNYIAGEWRPSAGGATYEKRNPADPDDVALAPGQTVEIRIAGIGLLRNPVGAAADLIPRKDLLHVG